MLLLAININRKRSKEKFHVKMPRYVIKWYWIINYKTHTHIINVVQKYVECLWINVKILYKSKRHFKFFYYYFIAWKLWKSGWLTVGFFLFSIFLKFQTQ
jgi:hypothetical protein